MNKWIKVFFAFLFVVITLSIVSVVFSAIVGLAAFAIKTFIFFSVAFFSYMWIQNIFKNRGDRA